jgi:hypothetical protein
MLVSLRSKIDAHNPESVGMYLLDIKPYPSAIFINKP